MHRAPKILIQEMLHELNKNWPIKWQLEEFQLFLIQSFFLLGFSFLVGGIGNFSPIFNHFNALICFTIFTYLYCFKSQNNIISSDRLQIIQSLGLLLIIAGVSLGVSKFTGIFLGVCVYLFGLHLMIRHQRGESDPSLAVLMWTVTIYTCLSIFYSHSSWLWYSNEVLADSLSKIASTLFKNQINFSSQYWGFETSGLLLIYVCVLMLFRRQLWFRSLFILFFSWLGIELFLAGMHIFLYQEADWNTKNWGTTAAVLSPRNWIFLLSLIPIYLTIRRFYSKLSWDFPPVYYKRFIPFLILIGLSTFVLTYPPAQKNREGSIAFYGKGHINLTKPAFGTSGGGAPTFGMLPEYLKTVGYDTNILNEPPTPENLSGVNTLVVINLKETLTDLQRQAVFDFVQRGGSLLVLGDHTGLLGIWEPLQHLLAETHIHFRFDSAVPFKKRWSNHISCRNIPIKFETKPWDNIGIAIGASLSVQPPAFPVVIGDWGFSDLGNWFNASSYLGDMSYNLGERLSGLVLAAAEIYGRGKILVFGDTASFLQSDLPATYPFVQALFSWLSKQNHQKIYSENILLALLFLILAIWVVKSTVWYPLEIAFLTALVFSFVLMFSTNARVEKYLAKNRLQGENVVYIDASRGGICYGLSFQADQSYNKFCVDLMRNGYLPLYPHDLKLDPNELPNCAIIVFNSPTKTFTKSEIQALKKYMEQGGLVFISAGWRMKGGVLPFLKCFGIDISHIPIGRVNSDEGVFKIRSYRAWALSYINTTTQVLSKKWNYPFAVFKPWGKGGLLFVADSFFFVDNNWENPDVYTEPSGNGAFLKDFLTKYSRSP